MHKVSVHRTCMDHHLLTSCDLSQQLANPQTYVPSQYLVAVLRGPDNVVLQVPYAVTTSLVVFNGSQTTHFGPAQYCPSPEGRVYGSPIGDSRINDLNTLCGSFSTTRGRGPSTRREQLPAKAGGRSRGLQTRPFQAPQSREVPLIFSCVLSVINPVTMRWKLATTERVYYPRW